MLNPMVLDNIYDAETEITWGKKLLASESTDSENCKPVVNIHPGGYALNESVYPCICPYPGPDVSPGCSIGS